MFSYNEWIPKLFPKMSDYDILREGAMKYHDCIKVFIFENYVNIFEEDLKLKKSIYIWNVNKFCMQVE